MPAANIQKNRGFSVTVPRFPSVKGWKPMGSPPRVRMRFVPCPPPSIAKVKTKTKKGRTGRQPERCCCNNERKQPQKTASPTYEGNENLHYETPEPFSNPCGPDFRCRAARPV